MRSEDEEAEDDEEDEDEDDEDEEEDEDEAQEEKEVRDLRRRRAFVLPGGVIRRNWTRRGGFDMRGQPGRGLPSSMRPVMKWLHEMAWREVAWRT